MSSYSSGHPPPIKAPSPVKPAEHYKLTPANQPTLSGWPLVVFSRGAALLSCITVGVEQCRFSALKGLKYLEKYPTRYDPCVVPSPLSTSAPDSKDVHPLFSKSDPVFHTSVDYIQAYQSKRTTPTAVAKHLLSLIHAPPHSIAFIAINEGRTLTAAKASTERYEQGKALGPLDGVPIAVKDEVDVQGYRKTFGSARLFSDEKSETTWAVKKLEEAGAIILGKTNMQELGSDMLNNNPVKGTPRNPYNTDYYTGGSSGGSAYAVGAGIVPIAVGVDSGGSIRLPASYCGVYGLKPSHGRISTRPSPNLGSSNGVAGPIAATIDDVALAYRIMSTPDPLHPSSSGFPTPSPLLTPLTSPRSKLLGIFRPWFDDCSPTVRTLCHNAVQALVDNFGYEIVEIDLPYLYELRLAHALTVITEMHAGIEGDLTDLAAPSRILLSAAACTPAHEFLQAARFRSLAMSHLAYLYSKHPGLIIVTPTTPTPGVRIRSEADLVHGLSDTNTSLRSMRYGFLANFSGCPAAISGVGYDEKESKLMVSLTGMAEWGQEESLFGFARDVAEATVGEGRRRGDEWVDVLGAVGAGREDA